MRTKGWQKVFSFSFVQYIKTKSFISGTIITCLLVAAVCVLTNILPAVMANDDSSSDIFGDAENPLTAFSAVYVSDEENILTPEDMALMKEMGVNISDSSKSEDEIIKQLTTSTSVEALVEIGSAKDSVGEVAGYTVKAFYSAEADSDTTSQLSSAFAELVNRRNMLNLGISADDYAKTQLRVDTSVVQAGSKEVSIFTNMIDYILPMVSSLILFILVFAYGQVVAQSIAMEKTSRVMELLLTSVRPLAVVIGKVLAMGLVSILQMLLIGITAGGSLVISAPFGMVGKISSIMSNPELMNSVAEGVASAGISMDEAQLAQSVTEFTAGITPLSIVLIFVIFILGYLFYALIAALVGASVSRMEDLQAAMGPYSILGVIGMYLAYFPTIFNVENIGSGESSVNSIQIFSYYFPVSSPFSLPSAIILNTMSMPQILISLGILAVTVVLVAVIVGKVYEAIILHNGNRIKFNDIIKMAIRK